MPTMAAAMFDPALLFREFGDEALVRDLARLLIETTPPQVDAVEAAVRSSDAAALRAAAHRLRGSIVTFGVPAAVETARKLEEMGAAGDLNGAGVLSIQLAADVQLLCEGAAAWLESGAPLPS